MFTLCNAVKFVMIDNPCSALTQPQNIAIHKNDYDLNT